VLCCRWRDKRRPFPAILHMFHDLASCLAIVHSAGRVHRDIKPDNCMLMTASQCWRLIDYGIAAGIGETSLCEYIAQRLHRM
jgi:serine/threonine protein kinase